MSKKGLLAVVCFLLLLTSCKREQETDPYRSWEVYLGDSGRNSYSRLDQINRDNVHQLEVAWTYRSGDRRRDGSQSNAIVIDGVIYFTTPGIQVVALTAATGKHIWSFNPFKDQNPVGVNRGVMFWSDRDDRRIFHTAGAYLYALDADTGELIPEFGNSGRVNLREGFDRDPALLSVIQTSPGVVFKDLLIMGSTTGGAPGRIRAYNARTGEIEWMFRSLPFPGEYGADTWGPDAWLLAEGANNWTGMSLDRKRELVIVPTGTGGPDFYSPGTRGPGKNLFGNTVLALDANTGELKWYYQTIYHDLWDYDLPAPPNLVTIQKDGREMDVVVQPTKQGLLFVLDIETGEPVFPVEERPVPPSDVPGEEAWPVQPFPLKPDPISRLHITEDDLTDISPEAREYALQRFREMRYEGLFTPISEQETLFFPGTRGGAEWGGAAYDPETNILYINANEYGTTQRLRRVEVAPADEKNIFVRGQNLYQVNCSGCHGAPGRREPSHFPSLAGLEDRLSKEQTAGIIASGISQMPGFPHLSGSEAMAIVEYLFNLDEVGHLPDSLADAAGPLPESMSETSGQPFESLAESTGGSRDAGDQVPEYTFAVDFAFRPFVDQEGFPATKPPWGTMNAIDMNTGDMIWKVPLGGYPELVERGIPNTGAPNMGGPIATAGGLVFIGAAHDEKFRAFDSQTGEVIWEYQLPAVGYATPTTYEIEGKQYIFIAATGGTRAGVHSSDTFIAFSLPSE